MSRFTKRAAQYFIFGFSLSVLLLFANVARGQNTISTIAGGAPPNNVAPTAAPIEGPEAIVRDAGGKSLCSERQRRDLQGDRWYTGCFHVHLRGE